MSDVGRCEQWSPCRLWSLWDMMQLGARDFYNASRHLIDMASWLSAHRNDTTTDYHGDVPLEEKDRQYAMRALVGLAPHLAILGTPVTSMAVADADAAINYKTATWGMVQDRFDDITRTLSRELSLVTLLTLNSAGKAYFSPAEPAFGQDVAAKFPSITYEIEEAGKCIALDRSTASVFHSVRSLEAGIRALSRCLGIPDPTKGPDRTWGKLLGAIKNKIDARWAPNTPPRLSPDAKLFERAHAALHAMMNPYRNDTMHLDEKYTGPEAIHVFEVVKGFMSVVASRCDENGEPKVP